MSLPVLICDDSSFARKQMARALPSNWDLNISFAVNGEEALQAIKAGKADLLFLDLNMPVLGGFEVLAEIQEQDLPTMVIVVSGDIQEETREKVLKLGALDFVKKPTDRNKINEILNKFGIFAGSVEEKKQADINVDIFDCYREITNVAMGKAAYLLGKLLNVRVILPIPRVNLLHISELHSALQFTAENDNYSAVCQGFIGAGIAGEALSIVNGANLDKIRALTYFADEENTTDSLQIEFIMDISNILIGACLQGIGEQIDITFNQGHPILLGQHRGVKDLLSSPHQWQETLAIEIVYTLENVDIQCEILLLFSHDTLSLFNKKVGSLMD